MHVPLHLGTVLVTLECLLGQGGGCHYADGNTLAVLKVPHLGAQVLTQEPERRKGGGEGVGETQERRRGKGEVGEGEWVGEGKMR